VLLCCAAIVLCLGVLCHAMLCCVSLQGIPELQQLLAYTAADVVHYAAER
jgi:hypothetical protein